MKLGSVGYAVMSHGVDIPKARGSATTSDGTGQRAGRFGRRETTLIAWKASNQWKILTSQDYSDVAWCDWLGKKWGFVSSAAFLKTSDSCCVWGKCCLVFCWNPKRPLASLVSRGFGTQVCFCMFAMYLCIVFCFWLLLIWRRKVEVWALYHGY